MPRLIYAAVTGYGLVGPEADVPAFDMTAFWTRSGVAHATIPPDQEPFTSRPGFGDHVTALATAEVMSISPRPIITATALLVLVTAVAVRVGAE